MTHIFQRHPFRIIAQFEDELLAETVCDSINSALFSAARQVDALFEKQNGVAEIADVSGIYLRYGFQNDSGWQQDRPLRIEEDAIVWDVPEGMNLQESEQLLAAFGAASLTIENDAEDDLIREVPHPAALFLSELEEDPFDAEEEELLPAYLEAKKTLH